jgi:hypothetical protein
MRGLWLLFLVGVFGCGWVMAADELEAGLTCEVFGSDDALEDWPTIPADKAPTVKKVDVQVNFESTEDAWPGTQLTDQFYIRWTGVIKIEKDAKYTFYTESDDGSRASIDGKCVVDNSGLHGMEEKAGDPVELKAGDHEIKIEFFENGGGAGCKFLWEAEGITKDAVPAKVLFHKK